MALHTASTIVSPSVSARGGGDDVRAEIGAPDTSKGAAYNNAIAGKKHLADDKELRQWAEELVAETMDKFKDLGDAVETGSENRTAEPPQRRKIGIRGAKPAKTIKSKVKPLVNGDDMGQMQRIQDIVIYAFQRGTKCSVADLAESLGAEQETVAACLGRALVEHDVDSGEMTKLISTIGALSKLLPKE